ncbi:hypothetical protein PM02_19380, partial [Sulfitobacter mediterraneus]
MSYHPLADINSPAKSWRNDSGFLAWYDRDRDGNYLNGDAEFHLGADLNIPFNPPSENGNIDVGQAVYTAYAGEIVFVGHATGYGNGNNSVVQYVTINDQKFTFVYGHVEPSVGLGSYLGGAEIGKLYDYDGSGSSFAHLHFAVAEGHTLSALKGYTDHTTALAVLVDDFGVSYVDVNVSGKTVRFLDPMAFIGSRNYAAAEMAVGTALGGGFIYDTVWFGLNDLLSTGPGDDTIYQGFDDDEVDGGDGIDTVIYNFGRANYENIVAVGNTVLVEGPEGTDHLKNVEILRFLENGSPTHTIDVSLLDGFGDTFITDLSTVGNTYSATMGNVAFTNGNSTPAILTTTSDWGINDLVQGVRSLWDAFTSRSTVKRVLASDGTEHYEIASSEQMVLVEATATELNFGSAGSLAFADLIQGVAPDDHTDTTSNAETIGSGAITSFTSAEGSIESRNDVDVFEAQLVGGQKYSFLLWANTTQNSRLDPEVTIRSPGGSVWKNDNLTNNTTMSFLSFVAPQSGTYVFEARGVGESTGSYWLNITPIDIDPTADNLTPSNESLPGFEWNGQNGDWHGDNDDDSFPTPGWDPHKGDLDAANKLRGHDGDDRIEGGRGNDIIWGDDDEDRLEGGDGDDTIRGGRHDDRIDGDDDDDLIFGEDGDDNIDGDTSNSEGRGDDTIYGGDGDDTIDGNRGDDYIKGEEDDDDIDGDDGNDELYGDEGHDKIDGGEGDDNIFGGFGNDDLDGDEGRDRLAGEDGDDTLKGDEGDDALYGGDDDDILRGGEGDDLLHGERGTDTADFSDGRDGVVVNLFDEIAVSNDLGTDLLYDIENVDGSRGDDVIDGDHSRNVLRGDDNDDIIRGHNGNDTIYGDDDDDVVWGDEGQDFVYGGDDDDEVRGGFGDDHLFGDDGDDHLRGEHGDDVIDGGIGTDTVFFWGELEDFEFTQLQPGQFRVSDLRPDGLEGSDTLTGVEFLEFFDGVVSISDLLAPDPSTTNDTASTTGNRAVVVDAKANDQSNASTSWISTASITSGSGLVSVIGGEVVFDPNGQFDLLFEDQMETVSVSYTLATPSGREATGTISLEVSGIPNRGVVGVVDVSGTPQQAGTLMADA